MTSRNKLEAGIVSFARVRRWLVAIFGAYVAGKGAYQHQWLLVALGAVIIAYGLFAPT